jgi:hypothetical protein
MSPARAFSRELASNRHGAVGDLEVDVAIAKRLPPIVGLHECVQLLANLAVLIRGFPDVGPQRCLVQGAIDVLLDIRRLLACLHGISIVIAASLPYARLGNPSERLD